MTTSLTIHSDRSIAETDDGLAIGEELDFTILATGYVAGDKAMLGLYLVSDTERTAPIFSKTVTLAGAVTEGVYRKTWSLLTSRSVGNYYLWAELTTNPLINTGDDCEIQVVIFNSWMLQHVYLAGVPLQDYEGTALNPQVVEYAVETSLSEFEKNLKIYLWPKTVRTQPGADDTDYDEEVQRISYIRKDHLQIPFIKLPHYYVQSVEWLKGYLGEKLQRTVNVDAIRIAKKRGFLRLVFTAGTYGHAFAPTGHIAQCIAYDEIPGYWDVKYVAGWDETRDGSYPRNWLQAIGWLAVIAAGPIISDALRRGISSESLSMDGVSESESTGASGQTMLLSARMKMYQDMYDKWLRDARVKYRGLPFTVA